MDLTQATAIVTGGSAGIGYEIARELKEKGAKVVICGRRAEKLEAAAKELGVTGVVADMGQPGDVEKLFEAAIAEMGSVNVLINNAGIAGFAQLVETDPEMFQKIWEVNVRGLFLAGQAAARHFIDKGIRGNIINIGSTAAMRGFPGGSAYVASKFAVSGLTECWRAELRKHNIRVFQINPSEVQTELAASVGLGAEPNDTKLQSEDIAHVVTSMLTMRDVGFITSAAVWATNPQ